MTDMLDERPAGLSSGQKQRVSLARALIRKPPVLLLDEPLGHLDAGQRQRVRRELKLLQREFGYTTIVVTHDQLEAMTLSDRMAVMDAGIIQQFGTPDEIFDDPANLFVADFVGEPAINLLDGTVVRDGGKVLVKVAGGGVLETTVTSAKDGQKVTVGVRPQDAFLAPGVKGTVFVHEDLMEYGLARLDVLGTDKRVVVQTVEGAELRSGDIAEFNVFFSPGVPVRPGGRSSHPVSQACYLRAGRARRERTTSRCPVPASPFHIRRSPASTSASGRARPPATRHRILMHLVVGGGRSVSRCSGDHRPRAHALFGDVSIPCP